VYVCLSQCVCQSQFVCLCVSQNVCLCQCVCVSLCVCLCVTLSVSGGGLRLSAFLSSFGAVFVDLCLPRCVCSEQRPGSGVLLFPLVFKARLTEEAACSVQGQQWPSCLGGHCGFVYLLRPD